MISKGNVKIMAGASMENFLRFQFSNLLETIALHYSHKIQPCRVHIGEPYMLSLSREGWRNWSTQLLPVLNCNHWFRIMRSHLQPTILFQESTASYIFMVSFLWSCIIQFQFLVSIAAITSVPQSIWTLSIPIAYFGKPRRNQA